MKIQFVEDEETEVSEPIAPPKPIARKIDKKVSLVKNIETKKKVSQKAEKSTLKEDLVFNVSGMTIMLELNSKTLTRTKSGILGQYGIKNYSNMINDELDYELSKLITNGVLKVLKGAEQKE